MFLLEVVRQAEDEIRARVAQHKIVHEWEWDGLAHVSRQSPGWLTRLFNWMRGQHTVLDDHADQGRPTLEALLDAVAGGDLSPTAAERLLGAQISTLALLQAVAWGEVTPLTAQQLLRGQTS